MPRPYHKHGCRNMRLYHIYCNMKRRCLNPQDKDYSRYGGRGISMCDDFATFAGYRNWFTNTFNLPDVPDGLTVDRINNDDGYKPGNLKLSTQREQQNNRRSNKRITWKGETHTISEWGTITGIDRKTLEKRLGKYGWPTEKALTTPARRLFEHNGQAHTINGWAKVLGISRSVIQWRYQAGWSVKDMLSKST